MRKKSCLRVSRALTALVLACLAAPQILAADLPRGAVARFGSAAWRDGGPINHLAFSPNGKILAASAARHTRLWEFPSGKLLRTLDGESPAFSADGSQIALIQRGLNPRGAEPPLSSILIMDPTSGALLQTIADPHSTFDAVAWSPDGKNIAAALFGGRVRIYDPKTGKSTAELTRPGNWTNGEHSFIAYSDDGKAIVSSFHGLLIVWDLQTLRPRFQDREDMASQSMCAAWNPAHTALTVVSAGGDISLRAADTGKLASGAQPHETGQLRGTAAISPTGKYAAAASTKISSTSYAEPGWLADCSLSLVTLATNTRHELLAKTSDLDSVAFSPDEKILAAAGVDGCVRFWDTATGAEIAADSSPVDLTHHFMGAAYAAAMSDDGKIIAIAGTDRIIHLRDFPSGNLIKDFPVQPATITALAFSPDGQTLASCSRDGAYQLRNVSSGQIDHAGKFPFRSLPILGSAIFADGKVAMSAVPIPLVVDAATGDIVFPAKNSGSFDKITSFPDACVNLLYFSSSALQWWAQPASTFPRFDTLPLAKPENRDGQWSIFAVSPDRKTFLTALGDTVRRFNVAGGAQVAVLTPKEDFDEGRAQCLVRQVAFSPDGRNIVVVQDAQAQSQPRGTLALPAGVEQVIRVFDATTNTQIQAFHGHLGRVNQLTFHGRLAITASQDTTVLVWDLDAPPPPKEPLPADAAALWTLAISKTGDKAADALQTLAKDPAAAVAAVSREVASDGDDKEVAALIAALDQPDFAVRIKAIQALSTYRYSRPGAEFMLAKCILRDGTSEEGRSRAFILLRNIDPVRGSGSTIQTHDRDLILRMIRLLETAGGNDAEVWLKRFAERLPEDRGASDARAALEKLAAEKKAAPSKIP